MAEISIQSIIKNIKTVNMSPSSMEVLLDFERVLDSNNLYAFENWKAGELVQGPEVSKYRVKCVFSWPLSRMPNPAAAERLLPYGAMIKYFKKWLVYPIEIRSESDYRPGTKKPKLARTRVWLVEIDLPKHLIKDITRGSEEILSQSIDMEDLDQAYEEGLANNNDQENPIGQGDENAAI